MENLYNIKILEENVSEKDLLDNGFEKCNSEYSYMIAPIINQLPAILNTEVLGKSFKINLPAGVNMSDLLKHNGEFTTIFKGNNGKIGGTATLSPLFSNMALPMAVFTAMSIITSQFFLAQINQNLNTIKQRLENIELFLKSDKECLRLSNIQYIEYVFNNYNIIVSNELMKQANLTNIIDIKIKANADTMFYKKMITNNITKLNNEKISKNNIDILKETSEYIEALKNTASLYMSSNITELMLSGDYRYIDTIKENMINKKEEYKNLYIKFISKYDMIIDKEENKKFLEKNNHKLYEVSNDNDFCETYIEFINIFSEKCKQPIELAQLNNNLYLKFTSV